MIPAWEIGVLVLLFAIGICGLVIGSIAFANVQDIDQIDGPFKVNGPLTVTGNLLVESGTTLNGTTVLGTSSFLKTAAISAVASSLLYVDEQVIMSKKFAQPADLTDQGILYMSSSGDLHWLAGGVDSNLSSTEYVESTVLVGAAVSLTTNTTADVTSISLTAGNWEVFGSVGFVPAGSTVMTKFEGAISSTSATFPTLPDGGNGISLQFSTTGLTQFVPIGTKRVSLSDTTTIYLVARSTFITSTNAAYGYIGATRLH